MKKTLLSNCELPSYFYLGSRYQASKTNPLSSAHFLYQCGPFSPSPSCLSGSAFLYHAIAYHSLLPVATAHHHCLRGSFPLSTPPAPSHHHGLLPIMKYWVSCSLFLLPLGICYPSLCFFICHVLERPFGIFPFPSP